MKELEKETDYSQCICKEVAGNYKIKQCCCYCSDFNAIWPFSN